MNNIYVFGECMIELRADKALNSSTNNVASKVLNQSFAGDVLNTAVYMKRTFPEINTHFISALGNDPFSTDMLAFFEQEHIGSEFVYQSDNKMPGLYAIETDDTGERTFSYWRENSAAKQVMSFIDDAMIEKISHADLFFFSGISLAVVTPNDRPAFWQMVEKIKQAGAKIVFDPNYRPRMWTGPEEAKQAFDKAYSLSDVMLPGIDDFETLYGLTDFDAIHAFLKPHGIDELIVKNGPGSVISVVNNDIEVHEVTPATNVVDTTSAGDSFNGVYLGARLSNSSISEAITLAAKSAGFVIQHKGAIVPKDLYTPFKDSLLS